MQRAKSRSLRRGPLEVGPTAPSAAERDAEVLSEPVRCPLEIIQRHIKIMHGHLDVAPALAREEEKRQCPHDQDMKLPKRSILRNW